MPILDGCGGDIVSYTISKHPDMDLVMTRLLPKGLTPKEYRSQASINPIF